ELHQGGGAVAGVQVGDGAGAFGAGARVERPHVVPHGDGFDGGVRAVGQQHERARHEAVAPARPRRGPGGFVVTAAVVAGLAAGAPGRAVRSSLRRCSPGWSPSAPTGPGGVSEPRSWPPMTLRARLPFLYQPTPGIRPMRFSAMPWATACVLSPFFQSSWTSSLTSRSRKNPPGSVVTWFQVFLAPSTMLSLASENHCPGSFHSFLAPSHRPTASSLIPVTKSAPASQMPVPTSFSPWPIVSKS